MRPACVWLGMRAWDASCNEHVVYSYCFTGMYILLPFYEHRRSLHQQSTRHICLFQGVVSCTRLPAGCIGLRLPPHMHEMLFRKPGLPPVGSLRCTCCCKSLHVNAQRSGICSTALLNVHRVWALGGAFDRLGDSPFTACTWFGRQDTIIVH